MEFCHVYHAIAKLYTSADSLLTHRMSPKRLCIRFPSQLSDRKYEGSQLCGWQECGFYFYTRLRSLDEKQLFLHLHQAPILDRPSKWCQKKR